MPDPVRARTPGRLTRRLTGDTTLDAARLGVSPQTLMRALKAQVAERDFLLSLRADGMPLHRKQSARLRLLVKLFPLCAADAKAGQAPPRPVFPFVPWAHGGVVAGPFGLVGDAGPAPVIFSASASGMPSVPVSVVVADEVVSLFPMPPVSMPAANSSIANFQDSRT